MIFNAYSVPSLVSAISDIRANGEEVHGAQVPAQPGSQYAGYYFIERHGEVYAVPGDMFGKMQAANRLAASQRGNLLVVRDFADMSAVRADLRSNEEAANILNGGIELPKDGKFRYVYTGTKERVESPVLIPVSGKPDESPDSLEAKATTRFLAIAQKAIAAGSVGTWSLYVGDVLILTHSAVTLQYGI